MDPFIGHWSNLKCGGSLDIQDLLREATLMINPNLGVPGNHLVSWKFTTEADPVPASVTTADGKLWGQFPAQGASYYYEIVARTPPEPITAKGYLYGIVCKIDKSRSGGGEDLGDTGTWKAEEQHPEG